MPKLQPIGWIMPVIFKIYDTQKMSPFSSKPNQTIDCLSFNPSIFSQRIIGTGEHRGPGLHSHGGEKPSEICIGSQRQAIDFSRHPVFSPESFKKMRRIWATTCSSGIGLPPPQKPGLPDIKVCAIFDLQGVIRYSVAVTVLASDSQLSAGHHWWQHQVWAA